MYELICSAQVYDWGLKGEHSTVGKLFSKNSKKELAAGTPYAELWMGTHPSGPSFMVEVEEGKRTSLKQWIEDNPSVLGEKVLDKWGGELPFLFKVLSVGKALSIQAHPDKNLAKKLHEENPSVYKDGNHKPEMALALTEFHALCGFVSLEELKRVLQDVPEIATIVGEEAVKGILSIKEDNRTEESRSELRSAFTKLMSAAEEIVSDLVSKLKYRILAEKQIRALTEKESVALHLEEQYPDDIGVLASFFLNFVKLNPGEALYLGANEPHAYVAGECIECMATSDNVVRAGLTPKYRDVNTLCSMLTYNQGFPEILRGTPLGRHVFRYTPPFDEFEVDRCSIPAGGEAVLTVSPGPSILVVVVGNGKMIAAAAEHDVAEGHVYFVPSGVELRLTSGSSGPLQLYRAGVNSKTFQ